MAKHRVPLTHRKQRSILTDMLPFEVPPTFSNRGFYHFLKNIELEQQGRKIQWVADDDKYDLAVLLLFGFNLTSQVLTKTKVEWGASKNVRSVVYNSKDHLKREMLNTVPFNFLVAHNLDGRILTVAHPRNQVAVAAFYANYSSLITYYASLSDFSIRRPVSVARYAYFKDRLHEQRLEVSKGVEQDDREYEQLGSYFVYKKHRNINKFFESDDYHRCEKKYNALVQVDISKCFDSIYTHSISWATIGKAQTKLNLDESKKTFSGDFDRLMQGLNHNETNGIVIGPEFSRIFAEIILQSVDVMLKSRLLKEANLRYEVDYEIFRYVDDYFVFYNEASAHLKIIELLQSTLKLKKLSINTSKIKHYEKPIITEVTIAKERISVLLNSSLTSSCEEVDPKLEQPEKKKLVSAINLNGLIIQFKTVIKETQVQYGDLLNYTFSIVENKLERLLKCYLDCERSTADSKKLLAALLSITEFVFFIYAGSPKVNHTIRLCRIMSTAIEFLNKHSISYELKHLLFKSFYDNIVQQINKNVIDPYREVETLYLLISLSQIGREYWLPENILVKYFSILTDKDGNYIKQDFLNHFSITVLLSYMKDKVRYKKLRSFLEAHVVSKLAHLEAYCPHDAESTILMLDIIICPYIQPAAKIAIAQLFGVSPASLGHLQSVNDQWFTAWGNRFDIGRELDAKRSREVY